MLDSAADLTCEKPSEWGDETSKHSQCQRVKVNWTPPVEQREIEQQQGKNACEYEQNMSTREYMQHLDSIYTANKGKRDTAAFITKKGKESSARATAEDDRCHRNGRDRRIRWVNSLFGGWVGRG
jgi:hypothetical protein